MLTRLRGKYFFLRTYEEVDTGERHEGGAGDGEEEAGRVHERNRGVAVEEHEKYERTQVSAGHVGLCPEDDEDDDTERGREAVHGDVPEEERDPVYGGRHSRHEV